jgi:isopenicillin N synthase-like dioxygenase|eukprot:COSAG02_NODE_4048_length_5862_cov_18.270692_6_plen_361_part_00
MQEQQHGATTEFTEIPAIDMEPFVQWWSCVLKRQSSTTEVEAAGRATAAEVGAACRSVGFMVLYNTGIPDGLMDAAMEAAKRFFAAPAEHKQTASNAGSRCYRGYEQFAGKEAFEMGRELPETPDALPLHGPNRWPASEFGEGEFRSVMELYYSSAVEFARCLLAAMCVALGLSPDAMHSQTDEALAHLRLWKYVGGSVDGSLPEHTDHGFLTLLLQDGGGGLQARNKQGSWVDVPPRPHSLAINTGRLLSLWTGNVFPATFHRVLNNPVHDRYSLPLFFGTNYETVISPLATPQAAGSDDGGVGGSIVCGEYIAEGYAWQGAVNAGEATAADAAEEAGADYAEHAAAASGGDAAAAERL